MRLGRWWVSLVSLWWSALAGAGPWSSGGTGATAGAFSGRRYGCPSRLQTAPCLCLERSKGLDVSCRRIDQQHLIRPGLSAVADMQQTVMYLRLLESELSYFPDGLLDGLDVRHLIAQHCNISRIDVDAFTYLSDRLESLDLSLNFLDDIPSEALRVLTALVSLNLSYNRIQVVHGWAFRGLISLLRLSLYGNHIITVDAMAFNGIGGNLTRVNLGRNLLSHVPSESLQSISVLQQLDLQENRISELSADLLPWLGNGLDILNLADNHIRELPAAAFAPLRSLVSLDMERNGLYYIHPAAFEGVHGSIEYLKLGHNNMDAIPSSALQNVTLLRELDLRSNNISLIAADAFEGYGRSLKFMYLQKNGLQTIEPRALDNLDALEWLYLQSNEIAQLEYEVFAPVMDTLAILDVHDNPIHCDCSVSWFRSWLMGKGRTVVNQPLETRCRSPEEFSKLSVLDIPTTQLPCDGCDSVLARRTVVLLLLCLMATLSTKLS